MAGTLWLNGPLPTGGDHYCTVCSMLYKGAANQSEKVQELISAVNAMDVDQALSFSIISKEYGQYLPDCMEPHPAITMGISPLIQSILASMGVQPGFPVLVPLCWSHIFGLQLQPGGRVVPASADQMPPEQRGAVDLSKRRR